MSDSQKLLYTRQILDLNSVFSSFQETVWSLLKRGINDFERDNFSRKVDHRKKIRLKIASNAMLHACVISCALYAVL